MVVIRITDLDLPVGVTHNATDWQIATDPLFSNVILQSMNDEVNLTSIIFNEILDPDDKYYARARSLLSTGWTIWGNLDVFIVDDVYTTDDNLDMPGVITPPVITTDSDVKNHIPTLFNISVTGFSTTGTGSHVATSYFITDLYDNHLWSTLNSEIYKDGVLIDEVVLKDGGVYKIKAMLHSSSGDVSQMVTRVINVKKDELEIYGPIYDLDVSVDNEFTIAYNCDIVSTKWDVYSVSEAGLKHFKTYTNVIGKPRTIIIPARDLREYEKYYFKITATYEDGTVSDKVYKEISTKSTQYAQDDNDDVDDNGADQDQDDGTNEIN